jgi:preprotein translocase subunit SecB
LASDPHLAARGQLTDVYLVGLEFRRNPDFDFESDASDAKYHVETDTTASVSDDHTFGRTEVTASIHWATVDEQPVEYPFDLHITLVGDFEWRAPDMPADEIESWLAFNAEHLLWPYLRAYVAQITGMSDLPPLTLYTRTPPRPRLGRTDTEPERAPGDVAHG